MQFQKRFGRKIPVPSTMEIKRDLVVMAKIDALIDTLEKEGGSSEDLAAILTKLVDEHHISSDRAQRAPLVGPPETRAGSARRRAPRAAQPHLAPERRA